MILILIDFSFFVIPSERTVYQYQYDEKKTHLKIFQNFLLRRFDSLHFVDKFWKFLFAVTFIVSFTRKLIWDMEVGEKKDLNICMCRGLLSSLLLDWNWQKIGGDRVEEKRSVVLRKDQRSVFVCWLSLQSLSEEALYQCWVQGIKSWRLMFVELWELSELRSRESSEQL